MLLLGLAVLACCGADFVPYQRLTTEYATSIASFTIGTDTFMVRTRLTPSFRMMTHFYFQRDVGRDPRADVLNA